MGETTEVKEEVILPLIKDVDIDIYINEIHYVGRVTVTKTADDNITVEGLEELWAQGGGTTGVYYHSHLVASLRSVLRGEVLHNAGEPFDGRIVRCDFSGYYLDKDMVCELENGDMCAKQLTIEFDGKYYYIGNCSQHYRRRGDGYQEHIWAPDSYWDDRPFCECCGCYMEYDDDYNYSQDCCVWCEEEEEDSIIEDYSESHDHTPIYFGDYKGEFAGLGFELEVDCSSSVSYKNEETASDLCSHCGLEENEMRYAHDGSLNYGFECISQPHTVKAFWEKQDAWRKMLAYLSSAGYKSHDAGTCGLHVHVSRAMFGKSQAEQDRAIAKVYAFFDDNWEDLVKISRRTDFGYCEKNKLDYEQEIDLTHTKYEKWHKTMKKSNAMGHYVALNNRNCYTFEYRLGRGTLNAWSFFSWIDLVITITKNARRISINRVVSNDLLSWLGGIKESTAKYIYKRGAFRKEMLALFPSIEWETDLVDNSADSE